MENFRYADIHCHPNLKTFGHSFSKSNNPKSDMWYEKLPSFISKKIHLHTGVTKFSQASFTTLSKAKAKIILLSLYPFEKGFFLNPHITPRLGALLSDWGIEIGYNRIRYLQQHTDYFKDLQNEYQFVLNGRKEHIIDGRTYRWQLTANWHDVESVMEKDDVIAVIITIEGAHVFNSGLGDYGVEPIESEILSNISKVKQWQYTPLFIGLAHNFNNDLCGHARSLQRIGKLVNQEKNIDSGLSDLGKKVIHALLDDKNGRSIYIDLKHMSVLARQEYMQLLKSDYSNRQIPMVVSHGAVTGLSLTGSKQNNGCYDIFNGNDINFYDEEIVAIAQSNGLFALQMDVGINSDPQKLETNLPNLNDTPIKRSAKIIWNQLQHIATVLDSNRLFAWGTTAIGSDFDGSINPFRGIITAEGFEPMAKELITLANNFLSKKTLLQTENLKVSAEEIIDLFVYNNTIRFLKEYY